MITVKPSDRKPLYEVQTEARIAARTAIETERARHPHDTAGDFLAYDNPAFLRKQGRTIARDHGYGYRSAEADSIVIAYLGAYYSALNRIFDGREERS